MTTITPDEMKSLETLFMSETGTPSILLMEHAAQGVAAAQELGYTPDRVAQSLRLQRTHVIGLVTDAIAGALRLGVIDVLVTDKFTAARLTA